MSTSVGGRSAFDPYRKWLGIPADQRPPTYYQILGIDPDEQDPEIIEEAALRQTAHVRTYQVGPHAEECKKLLGEIALARVTLLKPEKRRDYDASLRKDRKNGTTPPPAAPPKPAAAKATRPLRTADDMLAYMSERSADEEEPSPPPSEPVYRSRGRGANWFLLMVVGFIGIILAAGGVCVWLLVLSEPGEPTHHSRSVAAAPTEPTQAVVPPPQPTAPEPTKPEPKTDPDPPPMPKDKKDPPEPKDVPKGDPRPRIDPKFLEPPPRPGRTPVPDKELQDKAEKVIRTKYKSDYARTQPASLRALADKLLQLGVETTDDDEARYVLYREARDLALKGNDHLLAFQAIEELDYDYEIDGLDQKISALEKASTVQVQVAYARRLIERALLLVDQLAAADQYDAVPKVLEAAKAVAQKANDRGQLKRIQERAEEVDKQHKDGEAIRKAIAVLKEKPDDAEAILLVGKYLWLTKGELARALPFLAAGSDAGLQAAARQELSLPNEWKMQVELGNTWWDLAKATESGPLRTAMRRRAQHWYSLALPELTGLTLERIQDRVKELNKILPDLPSQQWDQFDLTYATPMKNYLRVHGLRGIRTKDPWSGALEVTAEVRLEKDNLALSAGQGGGIILNSSTQPRKEIVLIRPDGNAQPESGTRLIKGPLPLKTDEWFKLRWRLTEKGMSVWINGEKVAEDVGARNDLTPGRPVRLRGINAWIDVKSIAVVQK